MNIYKISQTVNRDYDTYDSAVVYANNEEEARLIHPDEVAPKNWYIRTTDKYWYRHAIALREWTTPENVKVEFLGVAENVNKKGVILASYNMG